MGRSPASSWRFSLASTRKPAFARHSAPCTTSTGYTSRPGSRVGKPGTERAGDREMTSSMDDTGTSDFDFLRGDWLVRHRRLAERLVGSERWDTFDGTMTSRPILGGQG